MFIGVTAKITWAKENETTEIKIEAAGSIDYDLETNSTTASKDVVLKKGDITIECQELAYNGKTGDVRASGNVRITTDKFVYQTEAISYNLNLDMGDLAEFKGKVKYGSDEYYFTGREGTLEGATGTISKAVMTRCPKPKPHYVLTAKQINYDDQRVYLHRVVLKVKGIPVFYFPRLSFKTDNNDLPDVRLDYDNEEGLQVNFDYAGPVENNHSWHYRGEISTKGPNRIGFGVKHYLGSHFTNRINLAYDFDNFWVLDDQINLNFRLFSLSLDGIKEFSDREETQKGISVFSNYWKTPLGDFRLGILARDVYAFDSGGNKYGGTYWGPQLNYKPFKYLMLRYLQLNSNEKNEDFRDFLEDYKLGDNYLYNIDIPLTQEYSIGLEGTYNPDVENDWVRRLYVIKYENCCFRLAAGWNDLSESWEMNARIKF